MTALASSVTPTSNWTAALTALIKGIASGNAGAGTVIDGPGYATAASDLAPQWAMFSPATTGNTNGVPLASLNYVFIGNDFDPTSLISNFKPISVAALENGSNGPHEHLSLTFVAQTAGYMYIYLANDNPTVAEVYFDDFSVTQVKSPVIASNEYYPFGMQTSNSYARENSVPNKYLYNGKELLDALNINWLDYEVRKYMPDLGRWTAVDPLAEKGRRWSPYNYAMDNPVRFIDPDGMWPFDPGKGLFGLKFSISLGGGFNMLKNTSVTAGYRNQFSESTSFNTSLTYGSNGLSAQAGAQSDRNNSNVPEGSTDVSGTTSAAVKVETNLTPEGTSAALSADSKTGSATSDPTDASGAGTQALEQATGGGASSESGDGEPKVQPNMTIHPTGASGGTLPSFGGAKSAASYLNGSPAAAPAKTTAPPASTTPPEFDKLAAETGG